MTHSCLCATIPSELGNSWYDNIRFFLWIPIPIPIWLVRLEMIRMVVLTAQNENSLDA